MDGTIIDSEPFWKKAEHEIFSSLGVQLYDKMCQQTQAMTTEEVMMFWYEKYPWSGKEPAEVETQVIDYVENLIKRKGLKLKVYETQSAHPAVYLSVAAQMNVNPKFCVVFEDSYSRLKAAKLA